VRIAVLVTKPPDIGGEPPPPPGVHRLQAARFTN
jgi:hypothetical protein